MSSGLIDSQGALRLPPDDPLYAHAQRLVDGGDVLEVHVLQGGRVITGIVAADPGASAAERRRVYIRRASPAHLAGECSCGAAPSTGPDDRPCVHVLAVALAASREATRPAARTPPVTPARRPALVGSGADARRQRLWYLLRPDGNSPRTALEVSVWVGSGAQDACAFIPRALRGSGEFPRYVDPRDTNILRTLLAQRPDGPWTLQGASGAALLDELAASGRAHWASLQGVTLRRGAPRPARFAWTVLANGDQQLRLEGDAAVQVLLDFDPPGYVDAASGECGALRIGAPLSLLRHYWHHPPIAPEAVAAANAHLARETPDGALPRLAPLTVRSQPRVSLGARLVLGADAEATLWFVYNGLPIDSRRLADVPPEPADTAAHATVRLLADGTVHEIPRDLDEEHALRQRLAAALPRTAHERTAWLAFVLHTVPQLEAQGWEVIVDPDFPYRVVAPGAWRLEAEPAGRDQWFSLRLTARVDDRPVNLLPVLARYLESGHASDAPASLDLATDGTACYRVGDHWLVEIEPGRFLALPIERIQRIAETLVELFERDSLEAGDTLALPRSQAARLATLAADGEALHSSDATLSALVEALKEPSALAPLPAPAGFRATLRPYQAQGLGWLQCLRRHGLGGILADDMGLGKTLQTLAHLATEKAHGRLRKPALIVAPVSALGNWQQEIRRFTPELTLLTLHGSRRKECFHRIGRTDLVLIGYPALQLDTEALLAHEFYLVVLDEAQTIKNPRAKVARAARALRAEHRLCLTGTPLENHLGELWSLFEFVQPGYLGSEQQFQRHYRRPIERDGNERRMQALTARIAPLILRRTKDAVANDLPPKTEIVETIVLDDAQRDFYDGIRMSMHGRIRELVQRQGVARSQITILDALLKLRQACCDPRLLDLDDSRHVPSAKLDWLKAVLPELVAEGRRILLFSQFTTMLSLIEAAVRELGIAYCLLTGETQQRAAVVERFQSGTVPLFLISLKAGGTALNLTAADTVIHYDPWWNPAAEAQATDRAHRIGQSRPVFVYKLIAQDTVEERMLALQADKRALAERLYAGTPGLAGATSHALSEADVETLFGP